MKTTDDKQKIKKILKIIIVLAIAFMIVNSVINIIEPIIDSQKCDYGKISSNKNNK